MNIFAVVTHYKPELPAGAQVERVMDEHRIYVRKSLDEGKLLIAGPHVWEDGTTGGGGIILLKTASKGEAEQIMREDPIIASGIAQCTIYEFEPKDIRPELCAWIDG